MHQIKGVQMSRPVSGPYCALCCSVSCVVDALNHRSFHGEICGAPTAILLLGLAQRPSTTRQSCLNPICNTRFSLSIDAIKVEIESLLMVEWYVKVQ